MIPNPFNANFYIGNRQKLLESLPEHSIVVIAAHRNMQEAADTAFVFHQESNFQYLCGVLEPDWRLIIDKDKQQSILVSSQRNESHIAFDGMLRPEQAILKSGVNKVWTLKQYHRWLKGLAAKGQPIYTVLPQSRLARYMHIALNPSARLLVRQLRGYGVTPLDCRLQIAKLRAIKQAPEIKALQAAIDLTTEAMQKVIALRAEYRNEYDIEAELMYEFLRAGADTAWKPIVAAGAHACTLHHANNIGVIKKNDWILMDIGAKVHGYVADVARTVPVGIPAAWQLETLTAVAEFHDEAMALIKPGASVMAYVQQADRILEEKLKRLGLMKRRSRRELRRRMPHAIGHGLGIDAHDSLGRYETFQPGMVLTVEPGLYIPEKGFGVRIENDVLVTKDGIKNLSGSLPNVP